MSAAAQVDLDALKRDPGALRLYGERVRLRREGSGWFGSCPFHAEKTPSFSVSQREGKYLYFCHGCKAGGDILGFIEKFDKVPFNTALARVQAFLGQTAATQATAQTVDRTFQPVAPAAAQKTFSLTEYAKLEHAFAQSIPAQRWLLEQRGISLATAQALRLGYRQDLGRVAGERNQDIAAAGWVAFPSIENGQVVSLKYRSISRKAFCRQPGMATALFNTPAIEPLEPVFLVEGELDCAALTQAGYRAVSLPSANTRLAPAMRDQLLGAAEIILAGDNDNAAGTAAMEKLWADFGGSQTEKSVTPCCLLRWPDPIKDANQFWLETAGRDPAKFRALVDGLVVSARSTPMPGVVSLAEAISRGRHTSLLDHPERLRFPWPPVDRMAILLPGSVCVVSATNTGQGKTIFTTQATLHGARQHNEVVLNYQCELEPEEMANVAVAQVLHEDRNHLTADHYKQAALLLREVRYYVGSNPNLTTVGPVLDLIEAAIRRLGATVVVLDHIHFICRNEADEVQAQANAMQRIKRMAQQYRVKFVVVTQPRKAQQQNKGKALHVTDIKGSGAIADDADAILALHRDYIKLKDPANPPRDEYEPRTAIHRLKARTCGDGAAYTELMFLGHLASFHEISNATPDTATPAAFPGQEFT